MLAANFEAGGEVHGAKRVAFVSADDADAKNTVGALLRTFGCAVIDLGNLRDGGLIQQAGGPLAGLDILQRLSVQRSYWIPGAYIFALSEKHNAFLRLLKNKSFKEEGMAKARLYTIGTSTTLESNKSLARKHVALPVAVSVFPDEIYAAPRSWTEKAYPKLLHYNRLPKGGHFAAWQQPELFAI